MCGRFRYSWQPADAQWCAEECRLRFAQFQEQEIFPSEAIMIITHGAQGLAAQTASWGFTMQKKRVINARLETLGEKALFRPFLRWRCVIPCDGYIEWMTQGEQKVKLWIHHPQKTRLFLAGIYNDANEAVVLTMPAEGWLRKVHDRMPLLLDEQGMRDYLQGRQQGSTQNARLRACRADER